MKQGSPTISKSPSSSCLKQMLTLIRHLFPQKKNPNQTNQNQTKKKKPKAKTDQTKKPRSMSDPCFDQACPEAFQTRLRVEDVA